MIRRFIDRIFNPSPRQKKLIHGHQVAPKKITKRTHHINPDLLSKNAVKVTDVLQEAGETGISLNNLVDTLNQPREKVRTEIISLKNIGIVSGE